jgi:hypothetical protein
MHDSTEINKMSTIEQRSNSIKAPSEKVLTTLPGGSQTSRVTSKPQQAIVQIGGARSTLKVTKVMGGSSKANTANSSLTRKKGMNDRMESPVLKQQTRVSTQATPVLNKAKSNSFLVSSASKLNQN